MTGSPSDTPPANRRRYLSEASVILVARAKSGDELARDVLIERYLPRLRHWASGRLPASSRGMLDTVDVVDEAIMRAMGRLDKFEPRGDGALLAYLRQAVMNRLRDEARKDKRRPDHLELRDDGIDPIASPLEELVGKETLERYELALERLRPAYKEAVIGYVELGYSTEELQSILEKPSLDATRMTITRALARLAEEMGHGR